MWWPGSRVWFVFCQRLPRGPQVDHEALHPPDFSALPRLGALGATASLSLPQCGEIPGKRIWERPFGMATLPVVQVARCGRPRRESCAAEGLLTGDVRPCGWVVVVPTTLLLPGTPCTRIQVLPLPVGTGDWELLLVPRCRMCPMQRVAGFYINMRYSPKQQRLTLRCCSAASPRMLRRVLVHGQRREQAWTPRRSGIYVAAGAGAHLWLRSACLLLPLPFPLRVARQGSTWPVPRHLCASGPLSQGRCLHRWQQLASSSWGRWPGWPWVPTEPGV